MHILADMIPLMLCLVKFNHIFPPYNFFLQILEEKIFGPLFPNFDIRRHFYPKNERIWDIFI